MTLSPVAKAGILVTVGVLFAIAGLTLYLTFPGIFESNVKKRLVLSETSETYEQWKEPKLPIYINVYFFNFTNAAEISEKNMPVVEEIGPYVFREKRTKINITWNDNGTVSFKVVKKWYFQPDRTKGSLDDIVMTVNAPLLGFIVKMNELQKTFNDDDGLLKLISSTFIKYNNSIFFPKKVRQLIFEGYKDPLTQLLKTLAPTLVPYESFGWFYGKNGSHENQTYNIFTGKTDINKAGILEKWNSKSNVTSWDAPCNEIYGTMGDMWPPLREYRTQKLDIFVAEMCRTVSLDYSSDEKFEGIDTYRYVMDKTVFDNGKYVPSNRCFCNKKCLPAGGLDVSRCHKGAPVVMSLPHFLYSDARYSQNIIGLRPEPQNHSFYVDMQPTMGVPVNVGAKLQINVIAEKLDMFQQFENITERMYLPVLWFGQSAQIDEPIIKLLRFVTQDLPQIITIVSFLLVVIGGILLMLAILFMIHYLRSKKFDQEEGSKQSKTDNPDE